eukprot:1158494-Pelagomonas_calceolata.AAC.3
METQSPTKLGPFFLYYCTGAQEYRGQLVLVEKENFTPFPAGRAKQVVHRAQEAVTEDSCEDGRPAIYRSVYSIMHHDARTWRSAKNPGSTAQDFLQHAPPCSFPVFSLFKCRACYACMRALPYPSLSCHKAPHSCLQRITRRPSMGPLMSRSLVPT